MPSSHQGPQGFTEGASFDKLIGFKDFIGFQSESSDRDPTVSQIIIRYGQFNSWRTSPVTPVGNPKLAKVSIGGGHFIWAHSLEPNLVANDRLIMLTWGTAQAVILGKLVIA